MNQKRTWTIILSVAAILLAIRTFTGPGMGKVYVENSNKAFIEVNGKWVEAPVGTTSAVSWVKEIGTTPGAYFAANAVDANQSVIHLSTSRTLGVWIAALLTLFIFSFLYRDNPFYKFAESTIVGVSAAYWMVVSFWDTLVPKLFGKLAPNFVAEHFMPNIKRETDYWLLVPVILGVMLLCRLVPRAAYLGIVPLAFIVGTTSGLKFVSYIESDLLAQTASTMKSLAVVGDGGIEVGESIKQVLLFVGVIAGLVYFFFSVEHKGIVGKTARVGVWYLMITFGAAFGFTVMGRIALFAARCEFLFDDWLWLIDPTGRRAIADAVEIAVPALLL
ncbi:MAG: hypothetical protein O2800_03675 [Planctomycetota bacterium]|nr:hypothetical protein [Planctomycetota bacterium]